MSDETQVSLDYAWLRKLAHSLRVPPSVDVDDLVQEGAMAWLGAAERFTDDGEASLQTFAGHRVRGAMLDHLRSLDRLSVRQRRDVSELHRAAHDLAQSLMREPDDGELAEVLGWSAAKVGRTRLLFAASVEMRADETVNAVSDPASPRPDDLLIARESAELVRSAISELPSRQRDAVSMWIFDGLTQREIARRLGVSPQRVQQAISEALRRLAWRLGVQGVRSGKRQRRAA